MRTTIGMLLVAVMAFLGGCGDGGEIVTRPESLSGAGLKYQWDLDLRLEGQTLRKVWLRDDALYCLTDDNTLYCVDARVGHLLWGHKLGPAHVKVFNPVHHDGMLLTKEPLTINQIQDPTLIGSLMPFDAVVINTLTTAYVFDRRSEGEASMYRKIDLKFAASTGATANSESIFIGSTEGRCESLLLAAAVHKWDLQTEGRIEADPGAFDRLVYVASTAPTGNRFHAVRSREEYVRVWSQKLDGPVVANFHVDQRGCFVPCRNNVLYAFSPASGEPLWSPVSMDGRLTQDVQVSDRSVFQYADADKLYAINLMDGSIRWTMPEGRVILAAMKGNVYVLDDEKNLRIVNEIMGEEKAAVPMFGFDFLLPNTQAQAIYGATRDGKLYCINPAEDEVLPRAGGGF